MPSRPQRRRFDPARIAAAAAAQEAVLSASDVPDPPPRPEPEAGPMTGYVVAAVARGLERHLPPDPGALRIAVRVLADRLAGQHPGRSVEVRIPPYAAVQCVAGLRHTRGTPPNVVETDPSTFVGLACGFVDWDAAVAAGRVRASGERADLRPFLPLEVPRGPSNGS